MEVSLFLRCLSQSARLGSLAPCDLLDHYPGSPTLKTTTLEQETENEMVVWHHWLDGHKFEQALGVGDGQGGLACCSSRRCKESDPTERVNWLTDSRAGIPNLWDLVPHDLRWSWCNNNRNKVHNEGHAPESSPNHPPPPWSVEKLSPLKLISGAKNVGDHSSRASFAPWYFRLLSTK